MCYYLYIPILQGQCGLLPDTNIDVSNSKGNAKKESKKSFSLPGFDSTASELSVSKEENISEKLEK